MRARPRGRALIAAAFMVAACCPAMATLTEMTDIVMISARGYHSCGITTTGGVKCWGANYYGQLGDGTTFWRSLPVDVVELGEPVTAISVGFNHTCAVLASGRLKCWGSNLYGMVINSNGAPAELTYPTPVDALDLGIGVAAVAAGEYHTCAVRSNPSPPGTMICWGITSGGLSPEVVFGGGGATAAAASGSFMAISPRFVYHYSSSCALVNGGVQCWGYNTSGQLGDGTTASHSMPLAVTGLANGVQSISMGGETGCALTIANAVKCWGRGFGLAPVDVPGLTSGVASLSVGDYHQCALTTGGGVKCWGDNTYGQLGSGTGSGTTSPIDVPGLTSGVVAIAAGGRHSCALLAAGGVRCWGANGFNEVSNGGPFGIGIPPSAVMTGILPRLANISTRAKTLTGDDVTIGGFVVQGTVPKTVVVRARGPSLVPFGITNPLVNPKLDLYSGQTVIASNDDWQSATNAAAITASGFAPSNDLESAILMSLAPGAYTAIMSGVNGGTGVGIVEVFELDNPQVPLANISTRSRVQTGDDVMIAGIVIQGDMPQTVIIRARGPSLAAYGITNALANPVLQLFSGQTLVASNDDWRSAANASNVSASGFAPSNSLESAILITLQPGAYTAIVTGAGGGTGVGIVEVFAL